MPGQLRPDDLERCQPIELMIPDLIDRAHAAFAQAFENFVALAQHGAGLKRRVGIAWADFLDRHRPSSCPADGRFLIRRLACRPNDGSRSPRRVEDVGCILDLDGSAALEACEGLRRIAGVADWTFHHNVVHFAYVVYT